MGLPDTPYIVAGGVGGPVCYYIVTPARNALTLGATNSAASPGSLYKQVFSRGLARGWAGGLYPSAAACPSFICLGPAYHAAVPVMGVPGNWAFSTVCTPLTSDFTVQQVHLVKSVQICPMIRANLQLSDFRF